jgi:hypothetical protein
MHAGGNQQEAADAVLRHACHWGHCLSPWAPLTTEGAQWGVCVCVCVCDDVLRGPWHYDAPSFPSVLGGPTRSSGAAGRLLI